MRVEPSQLPLNCRVFWISRFKPAGNASAMPITMMVIMLDNG